MIDITELGDNCTKTYFQFEYLDWWLQGVQLHILVVSFYAMSNINQRAGLRSAFCLYYMELVFIFSATTLLIRYKRGCRQQCRRGEQIQQIEAINPTNLAAGGNPAPIGADNGEEQFRLLSLLLNPSLGALSSIQDSADKTIPSGWQADKCNLSAGVELKISTPILKMMIMWMTCVCYIHMSAVI